ncbi:MAG: uracil-DNA glycosylase family protein [Candidatus Symbiothrix sp.]|jgi:G:T/U-mismatch repair DNA glycosylase|nr:uracil-DNA glycosylase family protein [Candidatus Symbiothrix sp.]
MPTEISNIERHPLTPFLPKDARLLMLGSFPPPRKRWSMDFYYPNLNNDMWRVMGLIFFGEKNYFVETAHKAFNKERIIGFLTEKGIALFDTATVVRRLKDNAADQFLEIVEATDMPALLQQLPDCRAIAVTGQKAMDTLRTQLQVEEPAVGKSIEFLFENRSMRLFRMPSTSRAYPLPLERKAVMYETMLKTVGIE